MDLDPVLLARLQFAFREPIPVIPRMGPGTRGHAM